MAIGELWYTATGEVSVDTNWTPGTVVVFEEKMEIPKTEDPVFRITNVPLSVQAGDVYQIRDDFSLELIETVDPHNTRKATARKFIPKYFRVQDVLQGLQKSN